MTSFVVSAPGKVIIHGEHAVVYGKKALAASLNLRTFMKMTCQSERKLSICLPNIGVFGEWPLDDLPHFGSNGSDLTAPSSPSPETLSAILSFLKISQDPPETKNLAVVVLLFMYASMDTTQICSTYDDSIVRNGGLTILVSSNIPTGAGLGSSAAYSVCLAAALLLRAGIIRCPEEHSTVDGFELATWPENDLNLINKWAFIGENIIHGKASGIDNSVTCFGGVFKFQKGSLERLQTLVKLSILLTNTKVPRSTRMMVAKVSNRYHKYPEVMDPILTSIEAISDRCISILTTDDASIAMYDDLENLFEMNQQLLAALGVSHAAINSICAVSAEHGLKSKLTGAGGGGCAITLLRPDHSEELIAKVKTQLSGLSFDVLQTLLGATGVALHRQGPNTDGIDVLTRVTGGSPDAGICHTLINAHSCGPNGFGS